MLDGEAMIARCPACSQLFPIVGSGQMPCPFCGASIEVSVQRVASASHSRSSGRRMAVGQARGESRGPTTIETLAEQDVQNLAAREAIGQLSRARDQALRYGRAGPSAAGPTPTPWDRPTNGRLRAFFSTARQLVVEPRVFFRGLSADDITPALVFYLLVTVAGAAVQGLTVSWWAPDVAMARPGLRLLAAGLAIPLALVYFVGIYHAGASMLSGRRVRLDGVVRATSYASLPMMLAVVPGVGMVAGAGWAGLLSYHALRGHLGLRRWQAAIVLAMPVVPLVLAFTIERFLG